MIVGWAEFSVVLTDPRPYITSPFEPAIKVSLNKDTYLIGALP
uniref:Uncharacterized protein n=1 Tax=Candidatus Kentrum sp. MB TaxID=2138164 RepID=A0A450X1P4_9GAMM|nr:MAG: hypothetical protein BECKMB1821G_GA0114241_100429 [Candidatus Kentron sp. MB]